MTNPKLFKAIFYGEELVVLLAMSTKDYRSPRDQLRFLVRKEAQRRGLVQCESRAGPAHELATPSSEGDSVALADINVAAPNNEEKLEANNNASH